MTTATVTSRPSAPVRHAPLPPGQEKRETPATWWQTEEPREQVLERTLALPFTADSDANLRTRHRGLIKLLDWLEDQPGRTWQERWMASGAEDAGREWTRLPMQWLAEHQRARKYDRADLCCGMIPLLGGQVVRPAYRWLLRQRPSQLLAHIRSVTDPDGFAALKDQYTATGHAGSNDCNNALNRVTWIVASKGGTVHDVTIGDCVELQHAIGEHQTNGYHGKHLFYALLAGVGVFGPDAPARLKTVMLPGQLTPAALVDRQGITCTAIRDLLVDYLTERAVDVDYTTLEDMARTLAGLFWRDLEKHHPGIDSLRLDADTVTAWRERVRMVRDRHGTPVRPRVNAHTVFGWVRTFYQDLARWAADEPTRWGPWVAPCPVRDSDTDHSKNRARRKAAMDQRTRTLLPALPALVKAVERQLKDAQTCLATGREAPAGAPFTTPAGEILLRRAGVSSRVYADDPDTGRRRDLTVEEERAFCAWAIVEVLRHTGVRIEEALELTHHSFVAYQLPTTGEIVPMLQVAPSKLDQERLLLVSPELGEVLTAIIHRVRRGQQAMPLVSAYDSLERLWSAPMPFLFQRRCGPEDRAIPRNYIYTCLNDALASSGLTGPGNEQLRYTPHDFRRIFVTDALRSGLPPHIAARICGHRTVDTTLGYAAIYPEDVINHHRSFIARRRALRSGEEYREPTAQEWQDFLAHFELRKVALGTCARDFGTPCVHEHACLSELAETAWRGLLAAELLKVVSNSHGAGKHSGVSRCQLRPAWSPFNACPGRGRMQHMDDAFTLLRQAVDLLPEEAAAENGQTVGDVREDIGRQEWEMVLGVLIEIGDLHPVSVEFWDLLAEAARQMMLDRSRRWCEWRGWEVRHGTLRATLSLVGAEEGRRRTAFAADGRLRPMWDIGNRTAGGERELNIARLWVECAQELGPGETADVRLAPLSPEQWRHLKCGDVITMHEARPVAGTATVIEVLPPRA